MQKVSLLAVWPVAVSLFAPIASAAEAAGGLPDVTAQQQKQLARLWDMSEIRKHPLRAELLSTRKAPLVVPQADDWMNKGDAWVAKDKDAKPAKTSAAGAKKASDEQLLVEEHYYDSEMTPDGPNRIYCAIARPEEAAGPVPVVLIFHGGGGHGSGALALAAARRHPGMAGLAMDYNGQFAKGEGHVTQWKNVGRERKLDLVPNLSNYPMYHNVIAARRAIDFLETQPWADTKRIGCVGISYGGWVAMILAGVDDRVRAVTTGVSAGGAGITAGRGAQQLRWEPAEQRALWLAAYEPSSYAAGTKAGVFFQIASNDIFFWLSGAAMHQSKLPGEKGWIVRPNSNHGAGGPEVSDLAAPAFLRHILAGGEPLPAVSEFQVNAAGDTYTWTTAGPRPVAKAVLNWSPSKAVSPARYWLEFPARRLGDTWTARVPAAFARMASTAYVNITDEQGIAVSSTLLLREGLDSRSQPGPQWKDNASWDVERKAAAWRSGVTGGTKDMVEAAPPGGIRIAPAKGARGFASVTNSVVLASGSASQHRGLRLSVDGGGRSGVLKVSLLRDTMSMDEIAYSAEVSYAEGSAEYELPWTAFKTKAAGVSAEPWPFDGLLLEGKRPDGSAITVQSIEMIR